MNQVHPQVDKSTAPLEPLGAQESKHTASGPGERPGAPAPRGTNPMMAKALLDIDAFFGSSQPTRKATPKTVRPR